MNTTGNLTPAVQFYYDKNLLARALPILVLNKYGQQRNLKQKTGKQIKFRKYSALPVASTPLTEGITPVGNSLTATDLTVTIAQYGDYITLSDLVQLVSPDPVLTETGVVLGEQAAQTIEYLTWGALVAGTNVSYANGVAGRINVVTQATEADFRKAVRTLQRQNVRPITAKMNASTGIGTTPINASYIGVCHVDMAAAFRNATNFPSYVPVEKYPRDMGLLDGEIGALPNIRFVASTMARVVADAGAAIGASGLITTTGASVDVYQTLILGKDAYGVTELEGEGLQNIVKPLGSGGSSDPLNQRATSGWKSNYVAEILQEPFMLRLEHGVLIAP